MDKEITYSPARGLASGHFGGDDPVILTGKVFEIGSYPDRNFTIGPEEMDAAITAFKPVPNDLEHSRLRDVLGNSLGELRRLWRTGNDVYGEVSAPAWLAKLAGNALKVSLAFNAAKQVVGNALTLSPRISDAEVIAAFSGRQDSQALHDLAVAQGARYEAKFSVRDWLRGLLSLDGSSEVPTRRTASAADNHRPQFDEAAIRFADQAVRDAKCLPAEREHLCKVFLAALTMDSASGVAMFTETAPVEGEACFALRQLMESKPSHELGREVLSGGHTLLRSDGISEERRLELLGKTDLGREVTKAKRRAR